MSGKGRPSKMTDERIQRLLEALRAGNYITSACQYAGISESTYHAWMKQAYSDDATPTQKEFLESVTKARSEAEVRNVMNIQKAATDPRYWTASAWWLERSFPERWGRRSHVTAELSGPAGGPIEVADTRKAVLDFLEQQAANQASMVEG